MMTFGRLLGGVGVSGAGSLRHAFDADSAPEFSTPCNPCGGAANLKGYAPCRRPLTADLGRWLAAGCWPLRWLLAAGCWLAAGRWLAAGWPLAGRWLAGWLAARVGPEGTAQG